MGKHRRSRRSLVRFIWRAMTTSVTDDFLCPLLGHEGKKHRLEWLQVQGWNRVVKYEIPRPCVEALGVDCTPLDRRDERGHQETVWFTSGQAERMRGHRHTYVEAVPA